MSKFKTDLPDILDCFAAGLNYERTARRIGTSSRTIQRYIRRSYAGDPAMICHWQDQDLQLIDHMKASRAMAILMIEQQALDNALGHREICIFQGRVQYMQDPMLVGRPDLIEMLDLPDDLLRIDGKVQPLYVERKASDAIVTKMLESHMRKQYGATQEINVKHETMFLPRPGDEMHAASAYICEHGLMTGRKVEP
jgi:hypothetical protein